jgi:hypothetical protein
VANGVTGVSCVTQASDAKNLYVVNELRPVVRSKTEDCIDSADVDVRIKNSLMSEAIW